MRRSFTRFIFLATCGWLTSCGSKVELDRRSRPEPTLALAVVDVVETVEPWGHFLSIGGIGETSDWRTMRTGYRIDREMDLLRHMG